MFYKFVTNILYTISHTFYRTKSCLKREAAKFAISSWTPSLIKLCYYEK